MTEVQTIFEAVIVPHRSVGREGLRWIAGALIGLSAAMSGLLWAAGAWPAIGFVGVESGLAIWLIRRHALGPVTTELLILSAEELRVVSCDPKGGRREQVLPSGWLRVSLEQRLGRVPALWLRGNGRAIEIAKALGEEQKRALAAALAGAVHRVQHPVFDNPQLVAD